MLGTGWRGHEVSALHHPQPRSGCSQAALGELAPQAEGCWEGTGQILALGIEGFGMPQAPGFPQRTTRPLPEPVVWSEPWPCPVLRTHLKSLERSWYQPHMSLSKLQDSSGQREVMVWKWKGVKHHKSKRVPQTSLSLCSPVPLPKFTPCRGPMPRQGMCLPWLSPLHRGPAPGQSDSPQAIEGVSSLPTHCWPYLQLWVTLHQRGTARMSRCQH